MSPKTKRIIVMHLAAVALWCAALIVVGTHNTAGFSLAGMAAGLHLICAWAATR